MKTTKTISKKKLKVLLTGRFEEAMTLANALHRFQTRKDSPVPTVSHLLSVASLVLEARGTEDEAIGALLHDAQEDAGGPIITWYIRERFGDAVADIVTACSELYAEPQLPWLERKLEYIDRMPTEPASAQLVSSADKVHNVRSLLSAMDKYGDKVWNKLSTGRDRTVWYYRTLADIFSSGPSPLAPVLDKLVTELETRAGVSGRDIQPSPDWDKKPQGKEMPKAPGKSADVPLALKIAQEVHANQKDKSGAPYLLHPMRVMTKVTDRKAMLAAILHDVVEDSGGAWTLDRLLAEGVDPEVVTAVDSVSRRPDESYEAFVKRAAANPIGQLVKLADLDDNMDLGRLVEITPRDIERLTRYHKARATLIDHSLAVTQTTAEFRIS